jgi:hypothetical protein
MSTLIDPDTCWRTGEVARFLGISSQRVRQLVEKGKLEARPSSFGYLFQPEAITRFQHERRSERHGIGKGRIYER